MSSNNPFWEQQQQLFKAWNENMSKLPGMDAYENMYKSMMPNAADYWNKFAEMIPTSGKYWQSLGGFMPGPDVFTRPWNFQIPGMDVYTKVFDLWKGMGDPASFIKDYAQKYTDLMQDMFKNFMPAGSMDFFAKPQELMQTCVDFYMNVLGPWMKIDEDILQRIASGDMHAYYDFFKDFNQKYEESFAKMFNMMGLGLNRESNEDQMKAMSCYIEMLFSAGELMSLVMESCQNSAKVLVDRYQSGVQEGKVVTTFREFYALWYSVTEEVLLALFNTDEFSKVFGDFADKYAKYMIATNKVYERMLAPLPVPTKTDMDSLYRTVYDLRKEARDLRRELEAMKAARTSK